MAKKPYKLSKRLFALAGMVSSQHEHVWDTCCDHGYLGKNLLNRHASFVHFVDQLPHLMDELEQNLNSQSFLGQWQVHCCDAAKLPLNPNHRNLVIIAGVGGDLAIELIKAIEAKHDFAIEYLLCPVYHCFDVRSFLCDHKFKSIDEQIIKDKQRFYEVMLVANKKSKYGENPVSKTGEKLWQQSGSIPSQYLTKLIKHYEKRTLNDEQAAQPLAQYRKKLNELF